MKIICLGDSLTFGYGVEQNVCWVSLAQQALGGEWHNAGICGDTATGMLVRLNTQVLPQNPRYVLFTGGGNDILLTGRIDQAQSAMMAMVHQCAHAGVRPVIGIGAPIRTDGENPWLPLTDMARTAAAQTAYTEWLRLFVKTMRLRCVDFCAAFEQHSNPASLYQSDGLHPNAAGHRLMAEALIASGVWRREV